MTPADRKAAAKVIDQDIDIRRVDWNDDDPTTEEILVEYAPTRVSKQALAEANTTIAREVACRNTSKACRSEADADTG